MSKKYAKFSSDGELVHLLIEGVHDIPKSAVELDEVQWQAMLQAPDVIWSRSANGVISKQAVPIDLPQMIANARFKHETGGISVDGIVIDTGRDSQALITGAALSAMLDPNYVCTWKAVSGAVALNANDLIAIASAIRSHVQACFDRELALLAALANGSFTAGMVDEGWPGESYVNH
ncbi:MULTISPECIES: DUF4376 domain-containing protein [Pseudomonas]|uniref:DUF4376 domain-containing protein n=1 Tax=Pseudomonas TaxID=286 RepID=UPI000CF65FD7|nr:MULTISPECIES: DUF4376 domain-containing protein [Pseudomonas]AVJ40197.1 hypothetical protein CLM75_23730 [Pseudomonas lurida]MBC8980740.1 DUF4376 domain-containing protein [Pseudomonas lurida]PRA14333.1 hypothetical protein CQ002_21765 [Pseudomonas sp. MYb13]PRA18114.1 hypothetical protein CQ004_23595 [Pseudomonas lurida]PRA31016.1 hypothetical protein CQ005_21830 [Pseudomonas lurida]